MTNQEATSIINTYIDDYKYVVLEDIANNDTDDELKQAYKIWLTTNPQPSI